jgi:5'-methylthioadenosine nucleosidase
MPTKFYSCDKTGDVHIGLVISGVDPRFGCAAVGTTPAVIATYIGIETFKPDLIINAGTSGGFKGKTAQIGDVFLVSEFKHHDRRIPLPGYKEYGIGSHPAFATPNLHKYLDCKKGVCTTSNSFHHFSEEEELMIE